MIVKRGVPPPTQLPSAFLVQSLCSLRLSWGLEAWKTSRHIHGVNGDQESKRQISFGKTPPLHSSHFSQTSPTTPTSALARPHTWSIYCLKATLSQSWVFLRCPFLRTVNDLSHLREWMVGRRSWLSPGLAYYYFLRMGVGDGGERCPSLKPCRVSGFRVFDLLRDRRTGCHICGLPVSRRLLVIVHLTKPDPYSGLHSLSS